MDIYYCVDSQTSDSDRLLACTQSRDAYKSALFNEHETRPVRHRCACVKLSIPPLTYLLADSDSDHMCCSVRLLCMCAYLHFI